MNKFLFAAVAFAALAVMNATAAEPKQPTAEAILDKYIQRLGGQTALNKIRSRTVKGEMTTADGRAVPWSDYTQDGNKRAWIIEFPNAAPMMRVVNGGSGWAKQPDGGVSEVEAGELARMSSEAAFRLRMNPKGVFGLTYEKSEANGGDTWHVLKASSSGGATHWLTFSDNTGLLVRLQSEWDSGTYSEAMEDYREVDGVQFPFRRTARFNDFKFTLTVREARPNVPIDPSIFKKPKAQ